MRPPGQSCRSRVRTRSDRSPRRSATYPSPPGLDPSPERDIVNVFHSPQRPRDIAEGTSRGMPHPRYVCIHGHFYQPPRENPWLHVVEVEDSAAPFHDWNERITRECYAPNTRSRLRDG